MLILPVSPSIAVRQFRKKTAACEITVWEIIYFISHSPDVQIIPYDNGYYAETTVSGFSEFWINGGGKKQDHPLAAWLKDFTAIRARCHRPTGLDQLAGSRVLKIYHRKKHRQSWISDRLGKFPPFPILTLFNPIILLIRSCLNGNNYYRLVLYLQNGDSLVSPVRKIFYEAIPAYVQVYPNPTTGDITIKTPSSCREIQIFDVLGRKLLDQELPGVCPAAFPGPFSSRGLFP